MLTFEDIMHLVGEPVWDKTNARWRVINGYRRIDDDFCISFTDSGGWERFSTMSLYKTKEEGIK